MSKDRKRVDIREEYYVGHSCFSFQIMPSFFQESFYLLVSLPDHVDL